MKENINISSKINRLEKRIEELEKQKKEELEKVIKEEKEKLFDTFIKTIETYPIYKVINSRELGQILKEIYLKRSNSTINITIEEETRVPKNRRRKNVEEENIEEIIEEKIENIEENNNEVAD